MVSQADSLDVALAALTLRPEHEALVGYCRGLAEQLDLHPDRASLWREYRPALEALLVVAEADDDDGQAALLQLVRTPMGDTKTA